MRTLIINADDFGDAPFTRGILEAHAKGPLTSATVLVNTEGAECAIAKAKTQGLPLGLHLNFTHGIPLTDSPSLLKDGRFLERDDLCRALEEGRISSDDITREAEAQFDRFIKYAGIPTHVDGHHHVHILRPVLDVLAPLLVKMGVQRMRIPFSVPEADEAKSICDAYGIRTNNHFIGLKLGWQRCTVEKVEEELLSLKDGCTEYMVHLAHPDDAPANSAIAGRAQEYATLLHPRILEVIRKEGIELVSYADI